MPQVDLSPNYTFTAGQNSVPSFVDALFAPRIRGAAGFETAIGTAAAADETDVMLVTDQALQLMQQSLWTSWNRTVTALPPTPMPPTPAGTQQTDWVFIYELVKYIQAHSLAMWVPDISFFSMIRGVPAYALNKYSKFRLYHSQTEIAGGGTAQAGNVAKFLRLFLSGAHVVVIHSADDLRNPLPSFYDLFGQAPLQPHSSTAIGHSHYTSTVALRTGWAYPANITTDSAPSPCPFICALLVDRTASRFSDYNTFFQLEGWPGIGSVWTGFGAKGRHGADYATHQATKWNISTYGATPFSEKRGLPVFLAPEPWHPLFDVENIARPVYYGADTPQKWLMQQYMTAGTDLTKRMLTSKAE
ncbi:hypothetical protein [Nisaea sp.]|uniref:hypothetical protein n=1 Tax=Nisaea sp. TaxID=2024842 RepID=UPI0032EC7333